ncbi:MAG: hypothetical protein SGJ27_18430 [Candidatus Melainabacteria bacterium]|nr:hypothetical protein [Candidatus Melainabacteria bacterium]
MSKIDREEAAKAALTDIKWLLHAEEGDESPEGESYLDGPVVVELLEKNFARLDPNSDGISRDELMDGISRPSEFSIDEYEMLRVVAKYFDTIITMADDQEGEELRITRLDLEVLKQFLVNGQMTLKDLKRWSSSVEQEVGLPPLSDG